MARIRELTLKRVPRRFREVEQPFVEADAITLLRDGREAFPAMLDAIAEAKQQVLLEIYWFESDHIGRRFAQALSAAAARGVDVALIFDAVGSIGSSREMFEGLARAGVRVVEYNPIAPWSRRFSWARIRHRDHRKILVVDGKIGFTGGINIADAWLPREAHGQDWRDDMVRIAGPAAAGLAECFRTVWRRQRGPVLERFGEVPLTRAELRKLRAQRRAHGRVQVLGESYFRARHEIARAYLYRLYRAKQRAWIANSYFLPDGSVLRALERAAARGVDVRVLLPGVSDVEMVRIASRAVWDRLLRAGVRIFEWHKSVLHSKSAVVDGTWSTTGTFNLDYLSLRSNLEVNVSVLDAEFGATLEASFERDFAESREVDRQVFNARPWSRRWLEQFCYRLRKFL